MTRRLLMPGGYGCWMRRMYGITDRDYSGSAVTDWNNQLPGFEGRDDAMIM